MQPRTAQATLRVADDCFVSSDAALTGVIILSPGCIIHPRATITVAPGAELTLGRECVVEENAVLSVPSTSSVGANNSFQVGCRVELVAGEAVGAWNVFAPRSEVRGVRVSDECTFGAGTVVGPDYAAVVEGTVPPRTVVYGATSAHRIWDGSAASQEQGVRASSAAFLREVLPKFNKVREEVKAHEAARASRMASQTPQEAEPKP